MGDKRDRSNKTYLKAGIYSINEVRGKLGEAALADPNADELIALTEQNGWVYVGTIQRVIQCSGAIASGF